MNLKIYFAVIIIMLITATITTNRIQERCMYIAKNTSAISSSESGNTLQKSELIVAPHKGEPSYKLEEGMKIIKKQTNTLFALFFPFLFILIVELYKENKKQKKSV